MNNDFDVEKSYLVDAALEGGSIPDVPLTRRRQLDALRKSAEEKGRVHLEEFALAFVDDGSREALVDAHSEVLPAGKHLHSVRKAIVHLSYDVGEEAVVLVEMSVEKEE